MSDKPYVLILGHARHGKDTVAEMIAKNFDVKFTSSSKFVAEEIIWPEWGKDLYKDFDEMFEDRVNHRARWADMIEAYNTPDPTKTAGTMFERGFDLYVGMRRMRELEACMCNGVFDHILWVRNDGQPPEGKDSFDISITVADTIITNNHDLEMLEARVLKWGREFYG